MQKFKRMTSRRSLVAGSIGSIIAAAAVGFPASASGQMYPGTRIAGIDVSGLSRSAAKGRIEDQLAAFRRHAVTFRYGDRTWDASLSDIGIAINYDAMLHHACRHGRDGSLIDQYATLLAESSEVNVPLRLTQDDARLRAFLGEIGDEIGIDPRDARLELRDGSISIIDHVTGQRLNVDAAVADTLRSVKAGTPAVVELDADNLFPDVTTANLEAARVRAEQLISAPVYLTHDGKTFPFDVETLIGAVSIDVANKVTLKPERLQPRIDEIVDAVYMPAQNVKPGWNNGLYVVEDDADGIRVDADRVGATVLELARSENRTGRLPVAAVKAAARTDNIDELGLEGHIGWGSSSFAGSSDARAANVAVSSRNISYKLVAPGENFSFNDLLGSITPENGFVEGSIIQGNWAATDIGGGVCQVSTTVFRAAAYTGFQFFEWHPHSWRLAFYEADGSPPGIDGAIYQPNTPDEIEKDLVFRNPLDSWLLLMMVIDDNTVYAHFYGKDNGWKVNVFEPRISEPKPVPPPVERVNPNLAPGERRKVQNAQAGCLVRVRRKVTATDDSVVSDGDFVSDYRSVPEAWEIGPD